MPKQQTNAPAKASADNQPDANSGGDEERDTRSQESSAGEPAGNQKNLDRPSAEEIFKQVARNAQAELKRSSFALGVSGIAGGLSMGLSGLGVAMAMVTLGGSAHVYIVSRMFYPLGFIVVIVGRAQLFTENTLYPVALVLAKRTQLWNTLRLWAIVLPANVFGAFLFAALVSWTPSIPHPVLAALGSLGQTTAAVPWPTVFWTGVTAGWLIATAAWLVSGSSSVLGSVVLIWLLTFLVGLGGFAHCIASSGEILAAVLTHQVAWISYPRWLLPAVLGNICGGVFMVTLLEYGQAAAGKPLDDETEEADKS
jgi:formate/nitrite transporter FocA (FNT family)